MTMTTTGPRAIGADIAGSARPILIVEDDEVLAEEMSVALRDYGLPAVVASTWPAALSLIQSSAPQLLLLDQRMGSMDTLTMIPALRDMGMQRIVVLTGNQKEVDRIVALEIGADDFLLKPISARELVARLRAHLRGIVSQERALAEGGSGASVTMPGGWRFAAHARRLHRPDGGLVPLTAAEFDLLAYLIARIGSPVEREILSREVLRRSWYPGDRALDNLVMHLRQKLGPGGDKTIASVRNAGYAFTGFPGAPES